ncbi:unnamed protein product [Ostreobium quekettii]|uniref:Uncharacterized protein n=1 Tax=Ostreobium quekettii TaxID=121088 RepID=A0A8S1JD11_9CHLO|nr:unnamed protein product [Ostreobium quekettii]
MKMGCGPLICVNIAISDNRRIRLATSANNVNNIKSGIKMCRSRSMQCTGAQFENQMMPEYAITRHFGNLDKIQEILSVGSGWQVSVVHMTPFGKRQNAKQNVCCALEAKGKRRKAASASGPTRSGRLPRSGNKANRPADWEKKEHTCFLSYGLFLSKRATSLLACCARCCACAMFCVGFCVNGARCLPGNNACMMAMV